MKPFDLAAAQLGDRVQALVDGAWSDVKFVGIGFRDHVIVDHEKYGSLRFAELTRLRMGPRTRTVWVTLFRGGNAAWSYECEEIGYGDLQALASTIRVEIEE